MSTVWQFYILGGIFMLVSFLIFSAIALLAGQIKSYTMKHRNSGIVFKWLQVIVFVGIAIFILV
jgi:threonine/homoserine/homoserine lactone efflux protein